MRSTLRLLMFISCLGIYDLAFNDDSGELSKPLGNLTGKDPHRGISDDWKFSVGKGKQQHHRSQSGDPLETLTGDKQNDTSLSDSKDLEMRFENSTEDEPLARSISDDLVFRLYTNRLGKKGVDMTYQSTRETSPEYDGRFPTKILIHGYLGTRTIGWVQTMKKRYLEKGSYNVIALDWSVRAGLGLQNWWKSGEGRAGEEDSNPERVHKEVNGTARLIEARTFYSLAAKDTMVTGKHVGKFVDNLVREFRVNLKDVHLIGHSLGAQVSGFAGAHMQTGKVGRITGLDPAAPLFTGLPEHRRLDKTDAVFVDVIHTDTVFNLAGVVLPFQYFGYRDPCGHVDFYPNGGGRMPECSLINFACYHLKATTYFIKTITKPGLYPAYKCRSLEVEIRNTAKSKGGNCKKCCDRCPEPGAFMGDAATPDKTGLYYAYTIQKHRPKCTQGRMQHKEATGAASRIMCVDTVLKINVFSRHVFMRCPSVVVFLFILVFIS